MTRKLSDSVVVVTGASSGIGRATAMAFARQGATVVVAARREKPLLDLVEECKRLGGRALAVPTDVTDEAAIRDLARRAVDTFGRIDIWVNNAAVALFGRFEEVPPDVFRRVIETNLFGYIYGARAALPYFREQGSGVLINDSSIVGKVGEPYTGPYVISKFGIRGLSATLRMENRDSGIHICTILPASIDTPLYQNGANYTGYAIRPLKPVYDAEKVAEAMVACAIKPRREVVVGRAGRALVALHTFFPSLAESILTRLVNRQRLEAKPTPPSKGNVFEPLPQFGSVSGGWRKSAGAQARIVDVAAVGVATLLLSALAWLLLKAYSAASQPFAVRK